MFDFIEEKMDGVVMLDKYLPGMIIILLQSQAIIHWIDIYFSEFVGCIV